MTMFYPRKGEIYLARIEEVIEVLVVIISSNEANALRKVIMACILYEDPDGKFAPLPTAVRVKSAETGLEKDYTVIAGSIYTFPNGTLVRREGFLKPAARERLEKAIQISLGFSPWPE